MKIAANFIKTFKENLRDWKILIIAIVFGPFFVYMMYMYLGDSGSMKYTIALLNLDINGRYSQEMINDLKKVKTEDGTEILNFIYPSDQESAEKLIRNKNADLFITIPSDFSESFGNFIKTGKGNYPGFTSYGDQSNIKYMMVASFIDYLAFSYISKKTGIEIPLNINYESAGVQKERTEYELYIPALFVLSIIMILFTAGASIIREIEKGTIIRLSLSKLSAFEFITALSLNQIIIGLFCLLLTILAAFSVGFRTEGSIMLVLLIGILTSFSVISVGFIISSFIKNMFGLLTVGVFPFFILMFFSDCFVPLPKMNLFKMFGNQVYLNDILPTATATRALNKVLNFNSGISDISFELIWMIILSVVYFSIGVILFKRKYKAFNL